MKLHNDTWLLELPDIIKANQLIRRGVNSDDFKTWYEELDLGQKRALTYTLCEFAHQSGVNDDIYKEVAQISGFTTSHPAVSKASSFRRGEHPDMIQLYFWIMQLPEVELYPVFQWFVLLFGVAEGRVYRAESKESCNHWWHRDLLDERIVQDLLNDPKFYMTSMKDDDRIK